MDGRSVLLHEENLLRIPLVGQALTRWLKTRVIELLRAVEGVADPDITVVIRSRNNLEHLRRLLDDLSRQVFDGQIELLIVDTSSSDGSAELAEQAGHRLLAVSQEEYTHPRALNMGFSRARHPWIFSVVGHSSLSHIFTLKVATRCSTMDRTLGAAGVTLPNFNATNTERIGSVPVVANVLRQRTHAITKDGLGIFAMNTAIVSKKIWQDLGGFDTAYGAGGEDGALCRAALAAQYRVFADPAMSVYHSHGLGPLNSVRQLWHWAHMGKPRDFSVDRLQRYRTDLL